MYFALINDDYILYTCLFKSESTSVENTEGLLREVTSRRKNENNLDSILVSPKLIILEETLKKNTIIMLGIFILMVVLIQ